MNHHKLILKVKKSPQTKAGRIQGLSSTFLYIQDKDIKVLYEPDYRTLSCLALEQLNCEASIHEVASINSQY